MSTGAGGNDGGPGAGNYMLQLLRGLGLGVAALGVGLGLVTLPVTDGAHAAMAPSLMQDEKGYISIFEKVCTLCMCSNGGVHVGSVEAFRAGRHIFVQSYQAISTMDTILNLQ